MPRKICGRRPTFTEAQAARVVERYWLGQNNKLAQICRDEGISPSTVYKLVNGWRSKHWPNR